MLTIIVISYPGYDDRHNWELRNSQGTPIAKSENHKNIYGDYTTKGNAVRSACNFIRSYLRRGVVVQVVDSNGKLLRRIKVKP
jgi:hypothetical protein